VSTLTPREVEVLGLVATGHGNEQIGRRLNVTINTVKAHISSSLRKLGANDRAHAVALAIWGGILAKPDTSKPSQPSSTGRPKRAPRPEYVLVERGIPADAEMRRPRKVHTNG
jgi:DNA-binding CsgD family transcriptional regulator